LAVSLHGLEYRAAAQRIDHFVVGLSALCFEMSM
jgi:hypothetical protein